MGAAIHERMLASLKDIYLRRKAYIALNALLAAVFYFLYTFIVSVQERGVAIILIPPYMFLLLVVTSSICMTIAVYAAFWTRRNLAEETASTAGVATAVVGGIISGCNCGGSIIFGLTAIGLSTSNVIVLDNFISMYVIQLFILTILVNVVVIGYYLNKLSGPSCRIRKKK